MESRLKLDLYRFNLWHRTLNVTAKWRTFCVSDNKGQFALNKTQNHRFGDTRPLNLCSKQTAGTTGKCIFSFCFKSVEMSNFSWCSVDKIYCLSTVEIFRQAWHPPNKDNAVIIFDFTTKLGFYVEYASPFRLFSLTCNCRPSLQEALLRSLFWSLNYFWLFNCKKVLSKTFCFLFQSTLSSSRISTKPFCF